MLSTPNFKSDDISCSRHSAAEVSLGSEEDFCAQKFYDGLDLFSTELDSVLLDQSNIASAGLDCLSTAVASI